MFEQINAQIPTRSHGEMSLIANSLKNMLKGSAQKHFGRQSLDFEEPGATRADTTYWQGRDAYRRINAARKRIRKRASTFHEPLPRPWWVPMQPSKLVALWENVATNRHIPVRWATWRQRHLSTKVFAPQNAVKNEGCFSIFWFSHFPHQSQNPESSVWLDLRSVEIYSVTKRKNRELY